MNDIQNNGIDIAEKLVTTENLSNKNELLETLGTRGDAFIKEGSIELIEKLFTKYHDKMNLIKYLDNFDFIVQQSLCVNPAPIYVAAAVNGKIHREDILERDLKDHSDKYLDMSLKEFWEEIMKTIKECGIDIDDLKKEYEKEKEMKTQGKYRERRNDIYRKIRPVYISLRKQGYTNEELIY